MRSGWSPIVVIAVTTLAIIAISIYCLSSGYFIIFQNLFYIPIIIACVYYTRRGFVFSVIIACLYFLLTIAFTRESLILLQAFVRVLIFILVAGVITYLSLARKRVEESLRQQHDNLEGLVQERTAQLEEDNTERKRAEEALRESEKQVRRKLDAILSPDANISALELSDIIDSEKIQKMMDELFKVTHMGIGIIDIHGNVLVGTGWQDICTKFHRINPESCRLCMESDLELGRDVPLGTFKQYRCKNNMWDIASPIKLVDMHLGNIFLGQFLFDDETVDYEIFRQQALQYGFNEQEYIAALDRVPRWSREKVDAVMSFYSDFAAMIGNLSYANVKLASILEERKQAEEMLRISEEKYRTILENIEDGYFEVDIAGNFTFFNDSMCRIYGYPREELMGMNDRQYTDQENAKKLFQTFNKVYRTGEPGREFDWEIIRKDGTKRSIESSVSLIKDLLGNRMGFRGIVRDVTDRKRAEEALWASEKRFRELFDGAPVGYHEIDKEGKINRVNRTELDMLGYTAEEMVGRYVYEFIAGEVSPQSVKEKLAGELPIGAAFERTYVKKDNTLIPVLIEEKLIKDNEGRIVGIRSTIQDITERKRSEEEKATLQEQLRQAQKIEAIGRLSGGIAHDFNNILTIISGNAQLSLFDLKQGDPLRENIEEIRRASERAADLTRQLLAFSRKQIMEMQVLDLNFIVQGLDKMLHRLLGEDIDLVTVLPEGIGRVKADPGQIEQVIVNLAVNARDAMIGGGKLTIETGNVELDEGYARKHIAVIPGRYVMLSVSDTGMGMSPEVRERVFEPFFTTKEQGKGTGLGLSTVYGIVKQSGGNIWVYSEPDKGTTFKIYLPRVDEPIEESEEKGVKEEILTGSETILVVEDDEEVRNLAVRILKKQGYNVLEASQGLDAFLICEEHEKPMHLLLTDVVMPKMNGRELADRIVSIHPEIKVLYMSGYTDNTIAHHGILEKGTNFMQKPFTVDGLARKVREVLDK
jgi:PAS domain S-box-containing protein